MEVLSMFGITKMLTLVMFGIAKAYLFKTNEGNI